MGKQVLVACVVWGIVTAGTAFAEEASDTTDTQRVSPSRRINHPPDRIGAPSPARPQPTFHRSIDGSGNHPVDLEMNAAETALARAMWPDYADGESAMAGEQRPSPRWVSNAVCDQTEDRENPLGTSDFLWQWGQFLDHDVDLTDGTDPPELAMIEVPVGDPWFDPDSTGEAVIPFNRSIYETSTDATREQVNEITGWIDASNVYGSNAERQAALRTLDGTGRLRTGPGNLLPDDETDLPNATGGSEAVMFLAGDVRANEQVGLIAMHTLFVREHNRIADRIRRREPSAGGAQLYERAREYVGALMQAITYREFVPALLGPNALRPYRGYDPTLDARIVNSFSTAAFRFGHSALSPTLLRLDAKLAESAAGPLALRDAFFSPDRIRDEGGIEPLLRGLAQQAHQRIDTEIVDDVRNFLFGQPGQGGFDLASLNVQRGRDHGLPSYATTREAYGLPAEDFADVTRDSDLQSRLSIAYGSVEAVDLWVGGLAEDPMPGGHLGPLFTAILVEQLEALRDGDRFWYEAALPPELVAEINATQLSDVIRRNTSIGSEIPDDVFRLGARPREERGRRRR